MTNYLPTLRTVKTDCHTTIRAALESAGVVFLPENGNGLGVELRKSMTGGYTLPWDDAAALRDFSAVRAE